MPSWIDERAWRWMDFTTPLDRRPFTPELTRRLRRLLLLLALLELRPRAPPSPIAHPLRAGGLHRERDAPFSESMDLIHTVTSCSSDTTSDTFSTKPLVSSEMCTSPSFFAPKSTKHPYSWTRFCVRECAREERATRGVRTRGVRLT